MTVVDLRADLDALKIVTLTDGEVWSARDIMGFAGYERWERFSDAISRAIASVNASGLDASVHFRGAAKSSPMPNGGFRQVEDVELTRYGCYILFQNADARKPEIAALQSYFAVQTRKQEIATPAFDPTSIEGVQLILAAATTALAKVRELEPKATAWDELADAAGDHSVGEAAKILARAGVLTGPQRLFEQLAALQWVFRNGHGIWEPYASAVDNGYLTLRPQSHPHPRTGERIIDPPQVRVTVRGLDRLRVRLSTLAVAQ
jgi:DNA-damage-inducible protein D